MVYLISKKTSKLLVLDNLDPLEPGPQDQGF